MHKKIYSLPNLETRLDVCDNGCVHLHIGPATIHVSAEGLHELRGLAQHLLAAVDAQSPAPPSDDAQTARQARAEDKLN